MDNKKVLIFTLRAWLPLAVVIIIFSGLIYAVVVQNYRQNANDPQISIAEDVAMAINQGTPAESIVPPTGNTEIKNSLSPFIIIYDDSKKLIGSSAIFDGKNPEIPEGILEAAKDGQNRTSWQTQNGYRFALVINRYNGEQPGYIVVGRSLREIENREAEITKLIAIAGGTALILTLLIIFVLRKFFKAEHVFDHTHDQQTGAPKPL